MSIFRRSQSVDPPNTNNNDDDVETPIPRSAGHGARLGNLFKRSTSIFERSPFFSIAQATTVDEDDQKALKFAFYNTAALVFIGVLFYTCTQVFYILEFCIRPLLWALLFGAVLYPVKQAGKLLIITGIDTLTLSGAPLLLGVVVLPFYALQQFLYWAGSVTLRTYKEMVLSLVIILVILLTDLIDIIDMFGDVIDVVLVMSSVGLGALQQYHFIVWTVALGYLVVVCIKPDMGNNNHYLEWLAMPIWAVTIATSISHLGEWRGVIAISVFGVLGFGTYAALTKRNDEDENQEPGIKKKIEFLDDDLNTPLVRATKRRVELIEPSTSSTPRPRGTPGGFKTPGTAARTRYHTPATSRRPVRAASMKFLENRNKISTDSYFSLLAWSVLFTLIGRDVFFVMRLLCLLLLFLAACQAWKMLKLTTRLKDGFQYLTSISSGSRLRVLCPRSIRGLAILMIRGQNVVLGALRSSTNQVVSAAIVCLMLLAIILVSCFILYTVHSEVIYLLQATSFFINHHTSYHLKTLDSSLGDISIGLKSVHSAGRGWIKGKIATLPEGQNTQDLESTLLSLYDNMYNSWVQRNISQPRSNITMNHLLTKVKGNMNSLEVFSLKSVKSNLGHLLSGMCTTEDVSSDIAIANYILCSKGMIVEVLRSLWTVFSSNMTLLIKLLFNFTSGILEGGAAFLNFVVQFAVFITALYYLLVYSDHYYAPVEIMTSLLTTSVERAEYTSALFDATRGIFGASFKLSVFYSCYVWVTHTLFGVEMVFMPALLAGVLSLIPVVGVYWSSVPGFLVLWLVDGRLLRAAVFIFLQILPTYFIDMAVYSEIEGGWHPYITGLAVAGGMYYFGLEGAIIGPLVICILKFTLNLYESVFKFNSAPQRNSDSE